MSSWTTTLLARFLGTHEKSKLPFYAGQIFFFFYYPRPLPFFLACYFPRLGDFGAAVTTSHHGEELWQLSILAGVTHRSVAHHTCASPLPPELSPSTHSKARASHAIFSSIAWDLQHRLVFSQDPPASRFSAPPPPSLNEKRRGGGKSGVVGFGRAAATVSTPFWWRERV